MSGCNNITSMGWAADGWRLWHECNNPEPDRWFETETVDACAALVAIYRADQGDEHEPLREVPEPDWYRAWLSDLT